MDCPKCYGKTTVLVTKVNEDYVRRRRECLECGHRYTTVEMVIDDIKLYIRQKAFYEKCKKMFNEERE
jgi:transcriptional regulator NrdR family protein